MCFFINKCCFCISLKSGAKIVSVLSLISSLATITMYGAAAWASVAGPANHKFYFYLFTAMVSLSQAVFSVLLVYGVFSRKPRCLWPWLAAAGAACAALLALSVLGVVLLAVQYYDDVETTTDISTLSSIYFVYAAIQYYFAIIINSRRVQMMRQQELQLAEHVLRQKDMKSLLA